MKIKICGITRSRDAELAAKMGAWAVGFIFVEKTPRYVSPEKVCEIIKSLPSNLKKVGVFADSSEQKILEVVKISGIDTIQLHGEETPDFCEKIKNSSKKTVIKAFRIKNSEDFKKISLYKNKIDFVLLDSFSEKELGGTGETFNWNLAKNISNTGMPVILAGGLNPDNILQAYNTLKPYACDISSGVELSKGIKDKEKLEKLFKNITLNPE